MEKDFVPYAESVALKELGFNLECIKGFYCKEELFTVVTTPVDFNNKSSVHPLISCPLFQQAFRWMRETHKLWSIIKPYLDDDGSTVVYAFDIIHHSDSEDREEDAKDSSSYEYEELECLRKMIEIVKKTKE